MKIGRFDFGKVVFINLFGFLVCPFIDVSIIAGLAAVDQEFGDKPDKIFVGKWEEIISQNTRSLLGGCPYDEGYIKLKKKY